MLLSCNGGAITRRVGYWKYFRVRCLLILETDFIDGCKPSSSTSRDHLFLVACADHFVMVLMAYLAHAFAPRKIAIQDFPGHDARMWIEASEVILFPPP